MGDLEKKTEEKVAENVKMNRWMTERINRINRETYWYLIQLLDLNMDDVEKNFPKNTEIFGKVFDSTVSILKEYGYTVCSPHITTSENGRQYRCTLSECGCERCDYQDDFREKGV